METNQLILALSKTLPESVLQGAAIYILLQLVFNTYKNSIPNFRFTVYYVASLILFAAFLGTFVYHFVQTSNASFTHTISENSISASIQTSKLKPNLRMQFSFWISHYANLISCFYLVGFVFCILKLCFGLINIHWFRSHKHLKLDVNLTKTALHLGTNFRLIKTVSVYLSDKIFVPMTIGFIKPIIVFPISVINHLSAEQTEAILIHELAHIKRNDYLLNILLATIRSFLFFNPAIWLMEREISKYRELCCDDLVLEQTQNNLTYAHALLLIEQYRNQSLNLILASNGTKYTLLNRIKRITNMKTNDNSPQNKLVVLLLATIIIGISVAWNLPVKTALKTSAVHRLTNFSMVKTVSDSSKPKVTVIANKMMFVHKAFRDSFKNEIVADTIFIEHQYRNKPTQKLSFQGKGIAYDLSADTIINSKNKFKIVLEDSTGNKKEYNSVAELPADAQKEFLKENGKLDQFQFPDFKFFSKSLDSNKLTFNNKLYSSPQWKKQAEAMRKQGEAMRKQGEAIRKQGEAIRKQFNSPEWKKQQEDIQKQGEEIQKQFNSPEWKKQMEDLRKQDVKLNKQFNSKKWRQHMEKLRQNSLKYSMPELAVIFLGGL